MITNLFAKENNKEIINLGMVAQTITLRRLRKEVSNAEASLGYVLRPCFKKQNNRYNAKRFQHQLLLC
jgi:hypothetical protein